MAQDAEMMEQIDRDVLRTHPGLHFFSGDDGAAVTHREVRLGVASHALVQNSQARLAPGDLAFQVSTAAYPLEDAAADTHRERRCFVLQSVCPMAFGSRVPSV